MAFPKARWSFFLALLCGCPKFRRAIADRIAVWSLIAWSFARKHRRVLTDGGSQIQRAKTLELKRQSTKTGQKLTHAATTPLPQKETTSSLPQKALVMSTPEVSTPEVSTFEEAQAAIKAGKPTKGSGSNGDKLKLYGLFKQATCGDNTTKQPWATQLESKMKWDAWTSQKGKSNKEAEAGYVEEAKRQIEQFGITTAFCRAG